MGTLSTHGIVRLTALALGLSLAPTLLMLLHTPPAQAAGVVGTGTRCDIGAVEYISCDVTPWLDLPLIMR